MTSSDPHLPQDPYPVFASASRDGRASALSPRQPGHGRGVRVVRVDDAAGDARGGASPTRDLSTS